jgi:hypothetical protein
MQPLLKTKQADIGYIGPLLSFSERLFTFEFECT